MTLVPAVYVADEEKEFFCKSHHFQAKQLANGQVEIIDWFGRSANIKISASEFSNSFIQITTAEFAEYEDYINSGESKKINQYIGKLKKKYSYN